jgi:hypothetical protein
MPLRGSASCSTFDVATRKVPALALVPRGHLQHAKRGGKKVAGSTQLSFRKERRQEEAQRAEDAVESEPPSPPRVVRRQPLGDLLDVVEEQSVPPHQEFQQRDSKEEDEGEEDSGDDEAELRLGERFLNVMALMARLASQSLGDSPVAPGSPNRLERSNTERTLFARTNTERALNPIASAVSPPSSPPPPPQQEQNPEAKSPKHAVREVAERLPRALQGQLTFDICMLLPAPLNDRQSPLRSPIRRKRLRKRVRRRRLQRRVRRTWQASHASWPPHASEDYIVDHSRQDVAGRSAVRLVERLSERKASTPTLPRVLSMPLPPLRRINNTVLPIAAAGLGDADAQDAGEDDEPTSEAHDSEEAQHVDVGDSSAPSDDEEVRVWFHVIVD